MTKQQAIDRAKEAELLAGQYHTEIQVLKKRLSEYECGDRFVSVEYANRRVQQVKDECYNAIIRLSQLVK